jgi:hypothetical protein
VLALAASGSNVYAGGFFTDAGGVNNTHYIAKWNGTSWSALGLGMNYNVFALVMSGEDLYAGGQFSGAGGSPANCVARWNGSNWSTLGAGMTGSVYALAASGSDLYAGGGFIMAGVSYVISKWNGSSWSALGSGMNGQVWAFAVSGSNLYVGGGFNTAGGKASGYIARAVLGDAPGYNQLKGTPLSGSAMQFSYIGYPATNYALDRTFDLSPPVSWVGQQTNMMSVSGVLMFTNAPVIGTNNFWRVRSVP